jgi:hypothetical protein
MNRGKIWQQIEKKTCGMGEDIGEFSSTDRYEMEKMLEEVMK